MAVPRRTILGIVGVLVAYLVTGLAWAISSPVGSSPDDDYHLTSIYCPPPVETSGCRIRAGEPLAVYVPEKVAHASWQYSFQPQENGNLAAALSEETLVPSLRVDQGGYPGGFYRVLHLLVQPDVDDTVVSIRMANVLLPLLLLGLLALVGRPEDRRSAAFVVAATSVPLGVFIWASTNPSSWAYSGMIVAWVGLLASFSAPTAPRWGISALVTLAGAWMAASARGDSGPYLALAAIGAVWLSWPLLARRLVRLVLPVAVLGLGLWTFFTAAQTDSLTKPEEAPEGWEAMTFTNMLELPRLPLGIYGLDPQLGLGWTDTPMPALVYVGAIAAGVVFWSQGLRSMGWRKGLGLTAITIAFLGLPAYMLIKDMVPIGSYVQSRYFLPLAVLVVGTAVLGRLPGQVVRLSLGQRVFVVGALGVAHAVALLTNISRYVTGLNGLWIFDETNVDRWWWAPPVPGPIVVWVVGSVAFAVAVALSLVGRDRDEGPVPAGAVSAPARARRPDVAARRAASPRTPHSRPGG